MKKQVNLAVGTSGRWASISMECAKGGGTTSFHVPPSASKQEIQDKGLRLAKAIWPSYELTIQEIGDL